MPIDTNGDVEHFIRSFNVFCNRQMDLAAPSLSLAKIRIAGLDGEYTFLVDGGASLSLMSPQLAEIVRKGIGLRSRELDKQVAMDTAGKDVLVSGKAGVLSFSLEGSSTLFAYEFLIMNTPKVMGVLGKDFMRCYGVNEVHGLFALTWPTDLGVQQTVLTSVAEMRAYDNHVARNSKKKQINLQGRGQYSAGFRPREQG